MTTNDSVLMIKLKIQNKNMKTKLFFLMLLLMSSSIFAQKKEVAEIKSSLKKEQQKVNKLFNERNNEIAKYQMVVKESKKAEAKVDSLKSKPNSPAYKNAVKRADALSKEQSELSTSLEKSKHQIDSINLIIANYKTTLQQLEQQQTESKKEKKSEKVTHGAQKKEKSSEKNDTEKEKASKTRDTEETKQPKQKSTDITDEEQEKLLEESLNVLNGSNGNANDNTTTNSQVESKKENKTTSQEATEDEPLDFWTYLYMIGIAIVFVYGTYLSLKKSMRCPKCGRWGTFEETGRTTDGKTSNGGGGYTYIHRIKYRCQNCGYRKEKTVRTNAKNKYEVNA